MHYYVSSLLCLLATMIFICSFSTTTTATLISDLCKGIARADAKNISYDFCVYHYENYPGHVFATTAPEVGLLFLELTISKGDFMAYIMKNIAKATETVKLAERVVARDCLMNYKNEVQGELEAGLKAMKDTDYNTTDVRVSVAMNASTICGEEMKIFGIKTPYRRLYDEFYQLAAISLGFNNLLRGAGGVN